MKALLVFKRSLLEREGKNPAFSRLDKWARMRLLESDSQNRNAIHDIFYTLISNHVDIDFVRRIDVKKVISKNSYDFIVAVGGDGTLFQAAHYAENTPCILVNSDPQNSVGVFASCTKDDFHEHLYQILSGKNKITEIPRGEIQINKRAIKEKFINDVLISHSNPANTYRFMLSARNGKEYYVEGSGLWVSTSSGSTAAIYAAGGKIMELKQNKLQYLVREPYLYKSQLKKSIGIANMIRITTLSTNGGIYIDGSRIYHKVDIGSTIILQPAKQKLKLINYDPRARNKVIAKLKRGKGK